MFSLSAKRMRIVRQIRNDQVQTFMKKTRYQLLDNLTAQNLTFLISSTSTSITMDQFEYLLQFANQDCGNAIIHLGNLLIDGILPISTISSARLIIGGNMYWAWLIRVIVEHRYCDAKLLEYCKRVIMKGKLFNGFQLEQCLQVIKKITQEQSEIISNLASDSQLIQGIIDQSFNLDEKISSLSYSCISSFICYTQNIFEAFIHERVKNKFILMVSQGLIKQKQEIRASACRITVNLLLKNVQIDQITERILLITQSEKKQKIQIELSHFWHEYMAIAPLGDILCLRQQGLLNKIDHLFLNSQNMECKQNCFKSIQYLHKKIELEDPNLLRSITEQISRLHLTKEFKQIHEEEEHF